MDCYGVRSSYTCLLHSSSSWLTLSEHSYLLTVSSFQPLYGKMSDIFGRKSCLLFAYAVFGLGCLWCGLAGSMNQLIAARVRYTIEG